MNLELQDKVVLISGGAKGIGEAITRSFAAEGAIPCILGRNREEASALVGDLEANDKRADSFLCEMTDGISVRDAASSILTKYGRIDCVVNNAGVNDGVGLRAGVDDFRASLEKNVIHCFVLVQACLDALIASRGSIVNIGTKCATTGQGGTSGYVAAKGALNAATKALSLEVASRGITVNAVAPGIITTGMTSSAFDAATIANLVPMKRAGTVDEVASLVAFLASRQAAYISGQIISINGGMI